MTRTSTPPHAWGRRVQLVLWAVVLAAAAVALGAYFLPHHAVSSTNVGGALACAFLPDCHVSPSAGHGPTVTHTGYQHSGPLPALLIAAMIAVGVVAVRTRRAWLRLLLPAVAVVVAGALAISLFDLRHMFDRVTVLWGERLFGLALIALLVTTPISAIATPILHLVARRRARAVTPSPR